MDHKKLQCFTAQILREKESSGDVSARIEIYYFQLVPSGVVRS